MLTVRRLLGRIASRNKDGWILKLFFTRTAAEALLARQEENHLHLTEKLASMLAEHIGVLIMTLIRVSPCYRISFLQLCYINCMHCELMAWFRHVAMHSYEVHEDLLDRNTYSYSDHQLWKYA